MLQYQGYASLYVCVDSRILITKIMFCVISNGILVTRFRARELFAHIFQEFDGGLH